MGTPSRKSTIGLASALLVCVSLAAAAEEQRPEALADGFVQAWNAHDMKAFGALFAEDADFVNVAGMWWKGRAEIQAMHERSHASRFKASTLTNTGIKVRMAEPDTAVLHVSWELEGAVDADGKAAPDRRGVMQIVAGRQKDGWRILAAQNTNAQPAR
jgi:uncharacterized protein (TIGR02246 family)